jgi:hypothetical protein
MTALLVPIAIDVLLVRDDGLSFAPTKMTAPEPSAHIGQRQRLLPTPFGDDTPRPKGAYLHWSMPDGLTKAQQPTTGGPPVFPAIPERWLVFRISGDATTGPRALTAWLLPDVNAGPPAIVPNALGTTAPPPGSPPKPGQAITVLGTGDLSWSAYYDNVEGQLSLHDDLQNVSGAVSYLVCGWYTHIGLDPLNGTTDATIHDFLAVRNWALPEGENASGPSRPTSIVCHGAAFAMGWPDPGWPGDAGVLGAEAGGPPDPSSIDVVIADTIAEAAAALTVTPDGARADAHAQRLVQVTLAGMLSELAHTNGPATLDTSLHMSRFVSLASDVNSETIWESTDSPTASGAGESAVRSAARRSDTGLAGAIASSQALAGGATDTTSGPDIGGALVSADRSTPRVFAPADPVLMLRGAGRSFTHGGDGRFNADKTLSCRLSGDTVTSFRAPGQPPADADAMLPAQISTQLTALAVPDDVLPLLREAISLDPSSATDLGTTTSTVPSADAATRAAWLDDPTTVPSSGVIGRLPSPVAAIGPVRPWTPLHVEWRLDWMPATRGVHGFALGDVDFELPSADDLPTTENAISIDGRCLLTASPGRVGSGGTNAAIAQLRAHGVLEDHPIGAFLASAATDLARTGGRAAVDGLEGAVTDQDLLSGSLEDFLATLRGQDTNPMVRPPRPDGAPPPPTDPSRPTNPNVTRAGLARLRRLRVVDAFGQYLDLLGSSATTPADDSLVIVGTSQAVDGAPGLVALVPRFNAKARVLMRYTAADGTNKDADTAVNPLCGFVLPSPIDGSLEFFASDGTALGRIRADDRHGAAWEEDPGQQASFGRKPSTAIPNKVLGQLADGLLAWDIALAVNRPAEGPAQTALAALNQLIDTTRWTVDSTASPGDEHLSLLLGHPVAVMRAAVKIDVQGTAQHSNAPATAVPVKLGTLAHTQDGLLAYFIEDDYTRAHAVDPAIGSVTPPGGEPISSDYVDLSPSFDVQPEQPVVLTLLVTPGADVHVTTGLLPQKQIGMRRDWVSSPLATLTPNWRYGPVLLDPKVTRVPVASDVRGIWTWYHRPDPTSWTPDTIVNADATAILADDRVIVQHGWIRLQLQPDPTFPGIPIEVGCITKPIRDAHHRIQGIGGVNGDQSPWWMPTQQAIQMIEGGRFFFFVRDKREPPPHGGDGRIQIIVDVSSFGNKYIRTVGDNDPANDLNSLPECPPH